MTISDKSEIEVTIWCTAYNHEKYIRSALEGFVMQKTDFEFEVIIHDDASTDKTADIIREYEHKYPKIIKPIYQKVNQYQLNANFTNEILLPNAKGKYIAYCEGDDYWIDENKLQIQYEIMKNNPHVSLCVHRVRYLEENGKKTEQYAPPKGWEIERSNIYSGNEMIDMLYKKDGYPFHTSSYFIKKQLLLSECCQQLRMNGDLQILHASILDGNVYYINEVMSYRRLWTVGNYNSRLKTTPIDEKCKMYIKYIEAIGDFDRLSDKKFHDILSSAMYSKMFSYAQEYGREHFFSIYEKHKKENKFLWFYSWKLSLRHMIFLMPQNVSNLIERLRNKVRSIK